MTARNWCLPGWIEFELLAYHGLTAALEMALHGVVPVAFEGRPRA